MTYTWNVPIDALFHLTFSDVRLDQYSLSCGGIKLKIKLNWPGFHCDSTTIGPIPNWKMGDEWGHHSAYFTYRLYRDTMWTPILNESTQYWLLKSGFWVETCCNGPVLGRDRTRNWTGNWNPLLPLIESYTCGRVSEQLIITVHHHNTMNRWAS
jgi:hypothetical protein